MADYKDTWGYDRNHTNSVHRHRAYHHIYLKNRKKYPLPFEAYEVHHIDGDKNNNRMDNLAILTPEQHDEAHRIMEKENACASLFGCLPEELEEKFAEFQKNFNKSREKIIDIFQVAVKEREAELLEEEKGEFIRFSKKKGFSRGVSEKYWEDTREDEIKEELSLSIGDYDKIWKDIKEDFQEDKMIKERNERIKQNIKKGFNNLLKKFRKK
ncbi:hypothetical protein COU61_02070 [Candidatus Pacearchaeota archaeon CG10_big_fil_rev_8_21_14_0_10_35_13]|nr:MAG: hypothetical protein COU61_02070 [Candidatus Pacearchaeota archaeon CG10_big_fil_rev_8_21_14_0_10_35_13]